MKADRTAFDSAMDDFLDEARAVHSNATDELKARKEAGETGDRITEMEAFVAEVNNVIVACDNISDTEEEEDDDPNAGESDDPLNTIGTDDTGAGK